MAGLVDGLGYEELGQAGSQVAAVWITGSVVSQSQISGANIYSTGAVRGAYVNANAGSFLASGTDAISKGTITAVNVSGTTAIKGVAGTITNVTGTGSAVYGNADFGTGSLTISSAGAVASKGDVTAINISGTTGIKGTTGTFGNADIGTGSVTISSAGAIAAKGDTTSVTVSGTTAVRGAAVYGAGGRETASAGVGGIFGYDVQAGSSVIGAGSNLWLAFPVGFTAIPVVTLSPRAAANNVWHITGSLNIGSAFVLADVASSEFDWTAVGAI